MKQAMTQDKSNWKFCLCCGLFLWFVLNLLQGIFTEIQEDEAYYALYGEHLAWGYFDHPPMVGLMAFLGSKLFSGILGVRFFTIIESCLSLFVMWKLSTFNSQLSTDSQLSTFNSQLSTDSKLPTFNSQLSTDSQLSTLNSQLSTDSQLSTQNSTLLFFTLAFSILMFNIYGFVTTPDSALILFSALFLLVYQRYLQEQSWKNALLMGLMMALMVYSKYHAFLLLGLIVLSNLKLLKDGKFYVACFVALALLMPHILWQIHADFPSFRYHLSSRSEPFRWSYFLEYLPNQLLIFNPFTFGAVVYVLLKTHSENNFERGLRFILIGFFFFFWLMSFRGHVEPHWTIVCVIPVVVLVYRKALIDKKLMNYTKRFILPSLLLVVAVRVAMFTPLASRFGFYGKEAYYKAIETVAGDHPVAFPGSFQQPALYHYFTGKESSTLRRYYDRKTQYDLWQFDTAWTGKPVFICGAVLGHSKMYHLVDVRVEGYLMQHFQSPNRLVTEFKITNFEEAAPVILHRGDTLHMDFTIHNPYSQPFDFQYAEMSSCLKAQYLATDDFSFCFYDENIVVPPHSAYNGHLFTVVGNDIPLGDNDLALSVGDGIGSFVAEEGRVKVQIVEKRE